MQSAMTSSRRRRQGRRARLGCIEGLKGGRPTKFVLLMTRNARRCASSKNGLEKMCSRSTVLLEGGQRAREGLKMDNEKTDVSGLLFFLSSDLYFLAPVHQHLEDIGIPPLRSSLGQKHYFPLRPFDAGRRSSSLTILTSRMTAQAPTPLKIVVIGTSLAPSCPPLLCSTAGEPSGGVHQHQRVLYGGWRE